MKKSKLLLAACLIAGMSFSLNACSKGAETKPAEKPAAPASEQKDDAKAEDKKEEAKKDEAKSEPSLKDWAGTWNDISLYVKEDEVQKGVKEKKKEEADKTLEEFNKKVMAEFHGLVIEGDKVTFLDNFKDKGGKEVSSSEYKFKESHEVEHAGQKLEWDVFEATSKDAKYPVLVLLPVHGEEEMTHFHMRYGKDAKELLAMDKWYPTFVKPDTTNDQVVDEVTE